jgi:hypothetical protein
MRIGCPKEIKPQEGRVGLTPAGADALVRAGHQVYIETNAGVLSGFADAEYLAVGAQILATPSEVYTIADMIIKVKEPLIPEYDLLREGQILFTYLHLAPDPEQAQALLQKKVTAIAYETVQMADGSLPLLSPMSEVAGRLAVQIGAHLLESSCGGIGILLEATGGYLLGFLLCGLIYWFITSRCGASSLAVLLACLTGLLFCYAFGTSWYLLLYGPGSGGLLPILAACVLPFLIPDLIKLTLAYLLFKRLGEYLK